MGNGVCFPGGGAAGNFPHKRVSFSSFSAECVVPEMHESSGRFCCSRQTWFSLFARPAGHINLCKSFSSSSSFQTSSFGWAGVHAGIEVFSPQSFSIFLP